MTDAATPSIPTLVTLDERIKALEGTKTAHWVVGMVIYGLIAFSVALAIYGIITAPSKKGILDESSMGMKSFVAQAIDDNNKWVKNEIGKQHADTIREVRETIVPGAISGTMSALQAGLVLANGKCNNTCTPAASPAPTKVAAAPRPAPVSTGCGNTCPAAAQPQQGATSSGPTHTCNLKFNGTIVQTIMTADDKACHAWTNSEAAKRGWVARST